MRMTRDRHPEAESFYDKLMLAVGLIITCGVATFFIWYLITHPLVVTGHP
jgi:hypothetical protein